MTQRDLVAKLRAYRRADERVKAARLDLDAEIARAVLEDDWQIIDVAELTGWSRETIRAIVKQQQEAKPPVP
jgi:hypothetical protein